MANSGISGMVIIHIVGMAIQQAHIGLQVYLTAYSDTHMLRTDTHYIVMTAECYGGSPTIMHTSTAEILRV